MKEMVLNIHAQSGNVTKIEEYLAGYDAAINIYDGNYAAPWLLSDIHASKWIIKTSRSIRAKDGKYKYTCSINWHRKLPDGSYLDDEENARVKEFFQKSLFIIYESPFISKVNSIQSIVSSSSRYFAFISWLYIDELKLNPKKNVLLNLTQTRLREFIKEYVNEGSFGALRVSGRIFSKYTEQTGNAIKSKDVYKLSKSEVSKFIGFLVKKDCYSTNNYSCKIVDRTKFAEIFGLSTQDSYSDKFTAFIRQFEPEVIGVNSKVLLPINNEFEYPGHTTPLVKDIINSSQDGSLAIDIISFLENLMKLKGLFGDELPATDTLKFNELRKLTRDLSKTSNVTPWIPLPICLQLINKSIGFVLNNGEGIVACLDEIYGELVAHGEIALKNITDRKRRTEIVTRAVKKHIPEFTTTRLTSRENLSCFNKYSDMRESPSVYDLVQILYGACFVVIAGLKPIRVSELSSIKYDCVSFKEKDGFWLEHDIKKTGINNILPEDAKPIPVIAVRAIRLLQKLNNCARKYARNINKKEQDYLLYSLKSATGLTRASIMDSEGIRTALSTFVDYIEIPLDEFGRRWYVNIHELRKSFLLTFFWTYKFSSLDSCRWMAGHKDPDHVLRYIEANIPGEEMVETEAEYAKQQLRLFSTDKSLPEMENIESLNQNVCKHFQVNSIGELDESELKEWLEYALETGRYKIVAYGIESDECELNATVAVKIQEK